MIRLFRKIRIRLLAEDRYSVYFLYAFGEVLLVIAGILLAFQIDNWGDQKQEKKIELGYLVALQGKFEQNRLIAEESIRSHQEMLTSAGEFLKYTGEGQSLITEEETSRLLANSMMNATKYVPSPGILQDLISSGNLSKISDSKLRELLSEWFIILDNTSRIEEEIFEHRTDLLDLQVIHIPFVNIGRDIGFNEMVKEFPDESAFDGDVRDILKIREFESRMALYAATMWGLSENAYPEIKQHTEKVIQAIDSAIHKP